MRHLHVCPRTGLKEAIVKTQTHGTCESSLPNKLFPFVCALDLCYRSGPCVLGFPGRTPQTWATKANLVSLPTAEFRKCISKFLLQAFLALNDELCVLTYQFRELFLHLLEPKYQNFMCSADKFNGRFWTRFWKLINALKPRFISRSVSISPQSCSCQAEWRSNLLLK
jgi:hypothetical protein